MQHDPTLVDAAREGNIVAVQAVKSRIHRGRPILQEDLKD